MGLPKIGSTRKVTKKRGLSDSFNWGMPRSTEINHVNEYQETGWVGDINLDQIISKAIDEGASDIHLTVDRPVSFTINGDIVHQDGFAIPNIETLMDFSTTLLRHVEQDVYIVEKDHHFSYIVRRGPYAKRRLRGHIGNAYGAPYFVFRTISENIPTMKDLGVESELRSWFSYVDGLFLICGSTGTGKSTTMAACIRDLQLTSSIKIETIEKPIEYMYPSDGEALVVQREVGVDVRSFYAGLMGAMRDAPDVILLGEVRDKEEVSELIRAADMGHLAISTMHTNSVATTLNRIVALFDGDERARILSTLSDSLRGLANQVLVKRKDGKGRFACREILTINSEVRELIKNGDVHGIRAYQKKHKITMEYALAKAAATGKCTIEEAKKKSSRQDEFLEALNEIMDS